MKIIVNVNYGNSYRVPRLCWTLQKATLTPVSSTEQPERTKATPGGGEMSHTSYMLPATTGIEYIFQATCHNNYPIPGII